MALLSLMVSLDLLGLLVTKDKTLKLFSKVYKKIENEMDFIITKSRSNHGGESENEQFENFYDVHGIAHVFSTPRTTQQTRVVERNNRSLQKMTRTMLNTDNLPH